MNKVMLPWLKRLCWLLSVWMLAGVARAEVVEIDNAELARLLANHVPLIDIRTSGEWQETGVVPGSHLLTFFNESGQANPGAWLERARSIAKPQEPVIVICRSGNRTKAVSQFLVEKAGYSKVYNVKSGIRAWIAENRPRQSATEAMAECRAKKSC